MLGVTAARGVRHVWQCGEAGKEGRIERKRGGRRREAGGLLLSAACLHLMLPTVVLFIPLRESGCSRRAVSGSQQHWGREKILNQCFRLRRHRVGTGGGGAEGCTGKTVIPSNPGSPFISLSPLLSSRLPLPLPSRHCLPLSLSHLACLKI